MNIRDLIQEQILPQIKQPIWDNWYIREKIGSGSFSVVYRVEAQRMTTVDSSALKVSAILADNRTSKQSSLDRRKAEAEQEALIMKQLSDSPHIVAYQDEKLEPFYVGGILEGYYTLIRMELLATLPDLLDTDRLVCTESTIRRVAHDIGSGLHFAHEQGIIHRDIKPDNLFVSRRGVFKLGDFNISKRVDTSHTLAGTPGYIAPEVYRAGVNADECYTRQADIYALGICLYQLMNGNYFPFEDVDTPESLAIERRMRGEPLPPPCNASPGFAAVILKACAYDTRVRYASMQEMLRDLEQLNIVSPLPPRPIPLPAAPEAPAPPQPILTEPEEKPSEAAGQDEPETPEREPSAPEGPVENAPESTEKSPALLVMRIAAGVMIAVTAGAAVAIALNRPDPVDSSTASVESVSEDSGGNQKKYTSEKHQLNETLTWEFRSDGVMIISGMGDMPDLEKNRPWKEYLNDIREVQIEQGVTSIGNYAFQACANLTTISLPNSVSCIQDWAFSDCTSLTEIDLSEHVDTIGIGAFDFCEDLKSITIRNPDCEIADASYTINSGSTTGEPNDKRFFTGTIYGAAGSTAQEYAKAYEWNFKSLEET